MTYCPSILSTKRRDEKTLLRRSKSSRRLLDRGWKKEKEASSMEDEGHKGKHQYIASITRGARRSSNPSKSIIIRKIVELVLIDKKEGSISPTNPKK